MIIQKLIPKSKLQMTNQNQILKLKGKTAVFIDWANVYGWSKSLKKELDLQKLFNYLRDYSEIEAINLYFGLDKHLKSEKFLKEAKRIGFKVISKEVKYIPVSLDSSHFGKLAKEVKDSLKLVANLKKEDVEKILQILNRKVLRRKCDFDMEISLDSFKNLDKYKSFLFFSGDGDFEPLYKFLADRRKQVIVIYAHGHLGKEIYQIKHNIYKRAVDLLEVDIFKKMPPRFPEGRD